MDRQQHKSPIPFLIAYVLALAAVVWTGYYTHRLRAENNALRQQIQRASSTTR